MSVQMLVDMGFPRPQAEKAVAVCGDDMGAAIDWIANNPERAVSVGHTLDSSATPTSVDEKPTASQPVEEPIAPGQAMSLVCQDCGKQLKNEVAAQAHAARTQHTNFAESKEEVKPLTAEEKQAQLQKVKELLAAKKAAREEQERIEQKEKEILRRKQGKQTSTSKEYYQMKQAEQNAAEMRQKKIADQVARKKVLEQIAKDKEERLAKLNAGKPNAQASAPKPAPTATTPPQAKKEHTTARLQIRLPQGQPITHTFQATDTLQMVVTHVENNRNDGDNRPFSLQTTFPRKVYSTVTEGDKTLKELGFCPSTMLVMKVDA